MIRLFRYDDGTDNEHGFEGWMPEFLFGYNVTPSTMIAHDVFDHRPGDKPTLGEEARALGAMLLTRYEQGVVPRYFSPSANLGMSLQSVRSDAFTNYHDRQQCRERITDPGLWTWRGIDNSTRTVIEEAVNYLRARPCADEDEEVIGDNIDFYVGWMVKGYRWARRFYTDPYHIGQQFGSLNDKAARLYNRAGDCAYPRLRVTFDRHGNYRCDVGNYERGRWQSYDLCYDL